jgi:hypothetical protein
MYVTVSGIVIPVSSVQSLKAPNLIFVTFTPSTSDGITTAPFTWLLSAGAMPSASRIQFSWVFSSFSGTGSLQLTTRAYARTIMDHKITGNLFM